MHPSIIYQSIQPLVHPSVYFTIHPSIYWTIHSATHFSIHAFIDHSLSINSSTHPSIYALIPSSNHFSIHPFSGHPLSIASCTHPSIYESIHPSIHQSSLTCLGLSHMGRVFPNSQLLHRAFRFLWGSTRHMIPHASLPANVKETSIVWSWFGETESCPLCRENIYIFVSATSTKK